MGLLFSASSTFPSLSLKDLLEARALYHDDLLDKRNVVGTAVGLYRIRKNEPYPSDASDHLKSLGQRGTKGRRTLFNSEVRFYSWPCIYAFVENWETEQTLSQIEPSDIVPASYSLPDGRRVPVCVIEARLQPYATDLMIPTGFVPRNVYGPGAALYTEGQGIPRLATAGCIVRNGSRAFVLTNRHALGPAGGLVRAYGRNSLNPVGVCAAEGLNRLDFETIYPNFVSKRQRLLMDIGLVEISNLPDWKTAIPGVAPVGEVVDLYDNALSLQLIGKKVIGRSAVSGLLQGEVQGLFYRYKAMGGFDYVSDFLIGPRSDTTEAEDKTLSEPSGRNIGFAPHHGDSGTLLLVEHTEPGAQMSSEAGKTTYHPFAILWGREEFGSGADRQTCPFALATSLSTALDQLDLDFVRELNADLPYVWGWVGHYAIGSSFPMAADLLTGSLKAFIDKNIDSLSISPTKALNNDPKATDRSGAATFVPLADVPDNVWKANVNTIPGESIDGRPHRVRGPGARGHEENENHFADLDLKYQGEELFLDLNRRDPDQYLQPKAWISYFASLKDQFEAWDKLLATDDGKPVRGSGSNHWGALPFRVHQIYDIMVKAASEGDQALFLVAGGVLIHYLGDACQPLHASYMSNGDPARVITTESGKKKLEADGVHGGYEDDMIGYAYQNCNLAQRLADAVTINGRKIPAIKSGYQASQAVIQLISWTRDAIKPQDIVDKWVSLNGLRSKNARSKEMWDAFGDATIGCMALGARVLAAIWDGAWVKGKGDNTIKEGEQVPQQDLMALYLDPKVVPSVRLDRYPDDPNTDWSSLTPH